MTNFFRKFRERFLSENKISKYLLYAVGEIVLVVIGILIALQLNNWNETQKERQWEKQFLTDLRNELKSDLLQIQAVYKKQSAMGNACKQVIELIQLGDKKNTTKIDSVYFITQNTNSTFFSNDWCI
jgi:hypothetical protein